MRPVSPVESRPTGERFSAPAVSLQTPELRVTMPDMNALSGYYFWYFFSPPGRGAGGGT